MVFSDKIIEIVKNTNGGNSNKELFVCILYVRKTDIIIDVENLSLKRLFTDFVISIPLITFEINHR